MRLSMCAVAGVMSLWMVPFGLGSSTWGDELTPSTGVQPETTATADAETSPPAGMNYEDQSRLLVTVYPIELGEASQVVQNRYNWTGRQDASIKCEIGFTDEAVVLRGELRDDRPFFQPRLRPAQPDWWKITYGADGVEVFLDDPTSATRQVRFALNLGSEGTQPRVDVLRALDGRPTGFTSNGEVLLRGLASQGESSVINVRAVVAKDALADRRFFNGPLRIRIRLHDLDGHPSTYLMMEQVVEKK